MNSKIIYKFSGGLWKTEGKGSWYFITLPKELSIEIRKGLQWQEEGWGRMKTKAQINQQEWDTAIWFDTKHGAYLLPVKSEIRVKAGLELGKMYNVQIYI